MEPRSLIASYNMFIAQMESGWARLIETRGHGVLESLRDANGAYLDGLNSDAPRAGLLVEDFLELVAEGVAVGDHFNERVFSNGLTKRSPEVSMRRSWEDMKKALESA